MLPPPAMLPPAPPDIEGAVADMPVPEPMPEPEPMPVPVFAGGVDDPPCGVDVVDDSLLHPVANPADNTAAIISACRICGFLPVESDKQNRNVSPA
jgi:hypothetical protein